MNLIVTPIRTRLTVSSLMSVKLHGPTLSDWNLVPYYVKSCLRKHQTVDDTRPKLAKPTISKETNPFVKHLCLLGIIWL